MTGRLIALALLLGTPHIPPGLIDPPAPPPPKVKLTPVTPVHPAELWRCAQPEATGYVPKDVEYVADGLRFWQQPFENSPWRLVYNDRSVLIALAELIGTGANGHLLMADARTLLINKQTGDMSIANVANPAGSGLRGHCERLRWPPSS